MKILNKTDKRVIVRNLNHIIILEEDKYTIKETDEEGNKGTLKLSNDGIFLNLSDGEYAGDYRFNIRDLIIMNLALREINK